MTVELRRLDFDTDDGFGARARLGLVVLETDQTVEAEARLVTADLDGVDWYHSRIAMEPEVTPATLTDMKQRLPQAAGLLPTAFGFDAVGYACTSAATLIGADAVHGALAAAHPDARYSNPITAAVSAFRALEARRIAVVTPYTADVTQPIADHFADAGLEVVALGSFLESSDLVVARITEHSVADAVRLMVAEADARDGCDAVFVSCTSLRLLGVVEELEAEVQRPVVSSNLALIWHLLRQAGVDDSIGGFGRLLRTPLQA